MRKPVVGVAAIVLVLVVFILFILINSSGLAATSRQAGTCNADAPKRLRCHGNSKTARLGAREK
jgi:hypothetical protein